MLKSVKTCKSTKFYTLKDDPAPKVNSNMMGFESILVQPLTFDRVRLGTENDPPELSNFALSCRTQT